MKKIGIIILELLESSTGDIVKSFKIAVAIALGAFSAYATYLTILNSEKNTTTSEAKDVVAKQEAK